MAPVSQLNMYASGMTCGFANREVCLCILDHGLSGRSARRLMLFYGTHLPFAKSFTLQGVAIYSSGWHAVTLGWSLRIKVYSCVVRANSFSKYVDNSGADLGGD